METATDPFLEALEADLEAPAVTALGGGHGLARALEAIQLYTSDVSAVVSVADDGGSSGRLAPALGIPPPGDIRRCLVALTPDQSSWRDLFEFRFEGGDVEGHSLGNFMIVALASLTGGFEEGVLEAERCLGSIGSVIPVALEAMRLRAIIDDAPVEGQLAIARHRGALSSIEVLPKGVEGNPRAVEAIRRAEQIVLGPGSLFTSTIATLLVDGIAEAVNASDAVLVYVCNLVTQDGETLGLGAGAHLDALREVAGIRSPDVVVANRTPIEVPEPHEALHLGEDEMAGRVGELVSAELVDHTQDWPYHHPNRLAAVLSALTPG